MKAMKAMNSRRFAARSIWRSRRARFQPGRDSALLTWRSRALLGLFPKLPDQALLGVGQVALEEGRGRLTAPGDCVLEEQPVLRHVGERGSVAHGIVLHEDQGQAELSQVGEEEVRQARALQSEPSTSAGETFPPDGDPAGENDCCGGGRPPGPEDAGGKVGVVRRSARHLILTVLLLSVASLAVRSGKAVIVRHDRDLERTLELGARFPAVCTAGAASGTLIGPRWVLTAAHVVEAFGPFDYRVRCDGLESRVTRTFVHPGQEEMPWDRRAHDVALLYLGEPIDGIEPVRIYRGGDELGEMQELGKLAVIAGTGFFGTAESGPVGRDGRRRAVTNRIVDLEEEWLKLVFSRPPGGTDLEGVGAAGDSGGPLLIEVEGEALLVGVGSYAEYIDAEGAEGSYGTLDFFARVSRYADWIDTVVAAVDAGRPVPSEATVPPREVRDAEGGLPGVVGTVAAAYFEAFNSGDAEVYRRFTVENRTAESLAAGEMEDRLSAYRDSYEEWGELRPRRDVMTSPEELFVLVESKVGGMVFGFTVEADPPHRLVSISVGD